MTGVGWPFGIAVGALVGSVMLHSVAAATAYWPLAHVVHERAL